MGRKIATAMTLLLLGAFLPAGHAHGQTGNLVLQALQSRRTPSNENGGLGPLGVRSFFPPTLQFLDFVPDQALTLPEGSWSITYQFAVSNTFLNSENPTFPNIVDPITSDDVKRGLTAADFSTTGYGIYVDAELERHQLSFNYGFSPSLEIGIDLAWVAMGGGSLDSVILDVEDLFNAVNSNRVLVEEGRFDYYLIYNGSFIHNTSQPFSVEPQDPVLNVKWGLTRGGAFMPAFSVKFSYKLALQSNPGLPRSVVSSGEADFGYSVLVGKRFGFIVAHFQQAQVELGVPQRRFQSSRKFRMFTLEFQVNPDNAFLVQIVSQTGLLNPPVDRSPTSTELVFSKPSELSSVGFKHGRNGLQLAVGFTEDVNSTLNEADISLFLELGWQF